MRNQIRQDAVRLAWRGICAAPLCALLNSVLGINVTHVPTAEPPAIGTWSPAGSLCVLLRTVAIPQIETGTEGSRNPEQGPLAKLAGAGIGMSRAHQFHATWYEIFLQRRPPQSEAVGRRSGPNTLAVQERLKETALICRWDRCSSEYLGKFVVSGSIDGPQSSSRLGWRRLMTTYSSPRQMHWSNVSAPWLRPTTARIHRAGTDRSPVSGVVVPARARHLGSKQLEPFANNRVDPQPSFVRGDGRIEGVRCSMPRLPQPVACTVVSNIGSGDCRGGNRPFTLRTAEEQRNGAAARRSGTKP